jgi:hypothetical protein
MKYSVTVKTFFGGFKPLLQEEFEDLSLAVEFATKNSDGKRHSMITTFQEGMRDMEFLFLFQRSTNEYTIRTNGKRVDNKPLAEVLPTVQNYIDTLLKPLPEIIILTPEELQKRIDERNAGLDPDKDPDDEPGSTSVDE